MNAPVTPCSYRHSLTGAICRRPCTNGAERQEGKCFFHRERPDPGTYSIRLQELIAAGDGDWRGFCFPERMVFGPAEGTLRVPISIDARASTAAGLVFRNVEFAGDLRFQGSVVGEGLVFKSVSVARTTDFRRCTFRASVRIDASFGGDALFDNSNFHGPFKCLGRFSQFAAFTGCLFLDTTEFVGTFGIDVVNGLDQVDDNEVPTRHPLFLGSASFTLVTFRFPERVQFRSVDLSRAEFGSTLVDGVSFIDVDWYQPTLGRRGVIEEVTSLTDPNQKLHWPRIEVTCRNIRRALEGTKDFNSASDFYIGEMEARRKQFASGARRYAGIEALYKLLSCYGTGPVRAVMCLGIFIVLHMVLTTAAIDWHCLLPSTGCVPNPELVTRSLSLLTIVRGPQFQPLPGWWGLADFVAQVLVVVQLALVVLSLRARIRRN